MSLYTNFDARNVYVHIFGIGRKNSMTKRTWHDKWINENIYRNLYNKNY